MFPGAGSSNMDAPKRIGVVERVFDSLTGRVSPSEMPK